MKTSVYLRVSALVLLAGVSAFIFLSFVGKPLNKTKPDLKESGVPGAPLRLPEGFGDYWYQGKAEISSYRLEQARYGEMRSGTAVLMFVAEDFSPSSLTKALPDAKEKIPVLKINFEKDFITGIYPYHMLMTTATPVDPANHPHSLKMSVSSFEWCGATYSQLNLRGNKYEYTRHSYFPNEGDQTEQLQAALLEDEIWNRIRLGKEFLPTGKIEIIHGGFFARLLHHPMKVSVAEAELGPAAGDTSLSVYTLRFHSPERELAITFKNAFPFTIESWSESYADGFGEDKKMLTTKASRIKTIQSDYWSKNQVADSTWRRDLGL